MACYVDSVRSYPDAGLRFTEFCHLLADTRDELHEMADALGIPRRFFQDHPWRWHHDLPAHLRGRAIELGAVEVEMHQVGALLRRRREAYLAVTDGGGLSGAAGGGASGAAGGGVSGAVGGG